MMEAARDTVADSGLYGRPQYRPAVNVYSRPSPQTLPSSASAQLSASASSSTSPNTSLTVPESPRRGSIFSSFKLKHRKSSETSPRGSPNSPGVLPLDGSGDGGGGAEQTMASPRRLGFFDQFSFRPRSKSDCRPKKVAMRGFSTSNSKAVDDQQYRPPMTSIPSVDEDKVMNSPTNENHPERHLVTSKPLFIDTKLANGNTSGGARTTGSGSGSKSARSPAMLSVDILQNRRRSTSETTESDKKTCKQQVGGKNHQRNMSSGTPTNGYISTATSLRSPTGKKIPYLVTQKSLDAAPDDRQSPVPAIIFRDPTSILSGADSMQSFTLENEDLVYSQFMKAHKAYDLIPTSSKLVVFDIQLPVKKAFFALVYNGVRAAPLFDSATQQFVGMLTITDFIDILQRYNKTGVSHIKELEEHKIATWRDVQHKKLRPLVAIDPNESLYKAVQLLLDHKVHRLPVTDRATGNVLYILTHKRLLKFLYLYIYDLPRPSFLSKCPSELGIGTYGSILTVHQDTPLVEALGKFLEYRVSALPVVDQNDRVVDIYAKFDVINLAADDTYNNLDITIQEALRHRSDWFEGVATVKRSDSLSTVIETLVRAEVHRLVVTDEENRVCGIVSLSDIFRFLVLRSPS